MEEIFTEVVQLAAKDKKKKKNIEKTEESTEETTEEDSGFFNQVNWQNPSWDLFLIAFFIAGALLYRLSLGKDHIIAILVSIYMSLAAVQALPAIALDLEVSENFTFQITSFVVLFVVLFLILSRRAVLKSLGPWGRGKSWRIIIFSILHIGLLVSVILSFLPEQLLGNFSEATQFIFTNEWLKFAWVIAPILAMIVFGKKGRDD